MKKTFFAIQILLFSFPAKVFAIGPPSSWLGTITGGGVYSANNGLPFITGKLIPFIVDFLILGVIIISMIFIAIGGISMIISGGSKEGTAKAKNTVTYAVVGLVLGLLSFAIFNIIGSYFGVNLLK